MVKNVGCHAHLFIFNKFCFRCVEMLLLREDGEISITITKVRFSYFLDFF